MTGKTLDTILRQLARERGAKIALRFDDEVLTYAELDARACRVANGLAAAVTMARAGVPAISVSLGMKIKGKPLDFAAKAYKEFNDNAYHSPQDELKSDWDFSGFVVLAQFALDVATSTSGTCWPAGTPRGSRRTAAAEGRIQWHGRRPWPFRWRQPLGRWWLWWRW